MGKQFNGYFANSEEWPKNTGLDDIQSRYIRNFSHELRAPLAILMGYADLLNTGGLGELAPEQQEAMYIIVNRAQELKTLVSRIGALLAVQADETLRQPFSLSALVAQMIEVQRAKAAESGVVLDLSLTPNLPTIIGDPQQLEQAIECLIENAVKFTPHDGHVSMQVTEEPGWVTLSVSDTGIGIDADDLEHLFQPLQQHNNTFTHSHHGLGLGLTLVKSVVDTHGGKLEVESAPGEGSRFTIKLPSLETMEEPQQTDETEALQRRILIVDDEEFVAFTLKEGLEKLPNCEVVVTKNGHDALTLFEQRPFDLLITDYKMPDMNGVVLASQVRKHYPRTGIIMVTAYSHDLVYEPSAAVTIQHVLNKPIRLSEIRNVALETLSAIPQPKSRRI